MQCKVCRQIQKRQATHRVQCNEIQLTDNTHIKTVLTTCIHKYKKRVSIHIQTEDTACQQCCIHAVGADLYLRLKHLQEQDRQQ